MGLAGKPQGVDGSQVKATVNARQIDEVAHYCESDVLNAYRPRTRSKSPKRTSRAK